MKPGSGNRRSRSRGQGKRPSGNRNYESNGPESKVRGTAQQVYEKYLALGRDATSAGDRIGAEAFYQFAEHYYRILNADSNQQGNPQQNRRDQQRHDHGSRQDQGSRNADQAQNSEKPAESSSETRPDAAADSSNEQEPANVDPADAPQPDIPLPQSLLADPVIPTDSKDGDEKNEEAPAAKPRRRRRRAASTDADTDGETETAA